MRPVLNLFVFLLPFGLAVSHAQTWSYPDAVDVPFVHPAQREYTFDVFATGFTLPVSATPLYDTGNLLVVSLHGRVWLVHAGQPQATPFLDLASRVTGGLGEQGLFTIALEPEPSSSTGVRRLVAAFTERDTGDLLVSAFPLAADLSGADHTRESVIYRVKMPEPFHHGGQVGFGPDGMLYFSIGSGESSAEKLYVRPAPAQILSSPLGKIMRVDLSGSPYRVPDDNPYTTSSNPAAAAEGALPEIWANGFRNPWKFTFGPQGQMYTTDVGEDRWEEVNEVVRGGNYGWPAREALECMLLPSRPEPVDPNCEATHFIDPLVHYAHMRLDPKGGQSVAGGAFVHDLLLPELAGHYVYADFGAGRVWSFDPVHKRTQILLETGRAITEVTTGPEGELLLLLLEGRIVRLVHAD